jgi:hypothetical protein
MDAKSRLLIMIKQTNMKNILGLFLAGILLLGTSCREEITDYAFNEISAPSEVSAAFDMAQDASGTVTVTPTAVGANLFSVNFGDGSDVQEVIPGEGATHTYGSEGEFEIKVIATGITGLTSEFTKTITISFQAPENLSVDLSIDPLDPFTVVVTPTADFASMYDVSFGITVQVDTTILDGESVSYTYPDLGVYVISVTAKGASATTITATDSIEILGATDPISLPIDFESTVVNYNFFSFGPDGDFTTVIDNPAPDAVNTSEKVGSFLKVQGSQVWAGTVCTLGDPIDLSRGDKISMKVWSPKEGIPVLFKLENFDNPDIFFEVQATTNTSDEWEELVFDLSMIDATQSYQKIAVFFDFGTAGDESRYYFDDIGFFRSNPPVGEDIEDFEGMAPSFEVFGNVDPVQLIVNPDASGSNTSSTVAQFTKNMGSEPWAGNYFEISEPLDLMSNSCLAFQLWSPKSGITVKLKLENADASITHEVDVVNTTANAWEELEFDFSEAPMADYVRIVTFFEFGTPGDDALYYFDQFKYCGASGPQKTLLEDFEMGGVSFENFGNIDTIALISNPDASGLNTTATVAQLTKNAGSEPWAGAFFENGSTFTKADFSGFEFLSWAPKSGITVKLKIENQDASITHEVDVVNTTANAWERLTYDFSEAPEADYVRVVVFFDFGVAGDDSAYYFDEFYTIQ